MGERLVVHQDDIDAQRLGGALSRWTPACGIPAGSECAIAPLAPTCQMTRSGCSAITSLSSRATSSRASCPPMPRLTTATWASGKALDRSLADGPGRSAPERSPSILPCWTIRAHTISTSLLLASRFFVAGSAMRGDLTRWARTPAPGARIVPISRPRGRGRTQRSFRNTIIRNKTQHTRAQVHLKIIGIGHFSSCRHGFQRTQASLQRLQTPSPPGSRRNRPAPRWRDGSTTLSFAISAKRWLRIPRPRAVRSSSSPIALVSVARAVCQHDDLAVHALVLAPGGHHEGIVHRQAHHGVDAAWP